MKKYAVKILAALMTVLVIFGCTSVSSFADDTLIDKMVISGITTPVAGSEASFNWVLETASCEKWGDNVDDFNCAWVETLNPMNFSNEYAYTPMDETKLVFEEGFYYIFIAYVKTDLESSKLFAEDLTATVNSLDAEINVSTDESNAYYTIHYAFPCGEVTEPEYISEIKISGVTPPVAGEGASFDWTLETASCEKWGDDVDDYTCAWVEVPVADDIFASTAVWHYSTDGESFTFENGKHYVFIAYVLCSTESFCYFAENMGGSINGKTANVDSTESDASVFYTFPCGEVKEHKLIDNIAITGVVPPIEGKEAKFDFSVPENAGYEKRYDFDGDCCIWIEHDSEVLDENDENTTYYWASQLEEPLVFKEDMYYTFVSYVKADLDHIFTDKTTSTVNGSVAGITDFEPYICSATYTFKCESLVVESLSVVAPPSKTTYNYHDEVSTEGLSVLAVFTNGMRMDVSDSVEVTSFNTDARGDWTATVKYMDAETTFNYKVKFSFGQWLLYIICFGWIWMK